MRIACPKCEWEPGPHDEWQCHCGHAWNAFDTHGRCPACGYVWRHTQCLVCARWSPHHDWYHGLPSVDELEAGEPHEVETASETSIEDPRAWKRRQARPHSVS